MAVESINQGGRIGKAVDISAATFWGQVPLLAIPFRFCSYWEKNFCPIIVLLGLAVYICSLVARFSVVMDIISWCVSCLYNLSVPNGN